jgi:SH3 domain protein
MPMKRACMLLGLLLLTAGPALAADTVYVTDKVYVDVRSDPHYESPVVHRLLAGTPLEVLGQQGVFTQVRDPQGRVGWIETGEVTADLPSRMRAEQLESQLEAVRSELARTQSQLDQAHQAMTEDSASEQALRNAQATLKRDLDASRSKLAQAQTELAQLRAELEHTKTALGEETAKRTKLADALATRKAAREAHAQAVKQLHSALTSGYVRGSGDETQAFLPPSSEGERLLVWLKSLDYLWLAISFAMLVLGFVAGAIWLRQRSRRKMGGMYLRI